MMVLERSIWEQADISYRALLQKCEKFQPRSTVSIFLRFHRLAKLLRGRAAAQARVANPGVPHWAPVRVGKSFQYLDDIALECCQKLA